MAESRLEIEHQILAAIRRIVRAIDLQSRQLSARCGLTGPQLMALRAVERLGDPTLGAIAREISIGKATLTGIIDRLERQLLVARSRNTSDRRKITVSLTDKGHETLSKAPPLLQDRFRAELRGLEEWERAAMLSTLQRIASMMDAESIEAPPLLSNERLDGEPENPIAGDEA